MGLRSGDQLLVDPMTPFMTTTVWVVPLLIAWAWRIRQAATPSAWLLRIAFAGFGAWAIWFGLYARGGEPSGLLVWKPTLFYWTLAAIAIVAPVLGWTAPAKIIVGAYFVLSSREWRWINRGFASACVMLGTVNLLVASMTSYRNWVDFKFSCLMILLFIGLFRLNFVWLPLFVDLSINLYRRAAVAYRYLSHLF